MDEHKGEVNIHGHWFTWQEIFTFSLLMSALVATIAGIIGNNVVLSLSGILSLLLTFILYTFFFMRQTEKKLDEIITLSIKQREKDERVTVFLEETDGLRRLFEVIAERKIQRVRILSAGLNSRWVMIDRLLRAGVRVEVLAQDPITAIDKRDANQTLVNVQKLREIAHMHHSDLLIRLNVNVVSVRAVLLYEPDNQVKHLFFGWYTYIEQNTIVYGSQNPTLYLSSDSVSGRRLCEWVESLMDSTEKEARDVPDDNTLSPTQHKT